MQKTFSLHASRSPLFVKRGVKKQSGLALIEALVALLVLALGILGLVGAQTRALIETRTTNSRAIAIRQIADLSDRMKLNRTAARAGEYEVPAWGTAPVNAPPTTSTPCASYENFNRGAESFTTKERAQCDVWQWRRSLQFALPSGQAKVELIPVPPTVNPAPESRQIRIIVAWRLNEKGASPLDAALDITDAAGPSLCQADYICHVQFVEI